MPSIQKGIKYFLLAKIIFGPAKSLKLREIRDLRLHSELRKYQRLHENCSPENYNIELAYQQYLRWVIAVPIFSVTYQLFGIYMALVIVRALRLSSESENRGKLLTLLKPMSLQSLFEPESRNAQFNSTLEITPYFLEPKQQHLKWPAANNQAILTS